MAVNDENKKELSPCIVSKAKYALGLKPTKPMNNKTCSFEYWQKVTTILAQSNALPKKKIADAMNLYEELASK
ncbi:hypothetical protein ACTJIJ_20130 [Niabella sp. 22666]|uniref:hypothetical protein n=1 Tax=Niabella sp. 22666 TaxID=3453954 RepID=UPI003F83DA22